jgi:hypothetical protein
MSITHYSLLKTILPWLLHHANRVSKTDEFYAIKSRLLKKYGRFVEHQVQYLEGKRCRSCGGSGIHHYEYDNYGFLEPDPCWNCDNGWYKKPTWVILERIRFGRYYFHQPIGRQYTKPLTPVTINGYVDHKDTKHGLFSLVMLYLLYNRKAFKAYWKKWYETTGAGWRLKWWLPRNWIYNLMHIIKKKHKAIPFRRIKKFTKPKWEEDWKNLMPTHEYFKEVKSTEDDLPF